MPDIKISQLPAATAAAREDEFEANQSGTSRKVTGAQVAMLTPKGYIYGLDMERISATSIRITTGAAHIESLGRVIELDAAITVSSISLGANTWGHAYLWLNGATPAIEVVATAPATAYSGSARSKTGDTSRRYLGSIRTDGSGNVIKFTVQRGMVTYQSDTTTAPNRVLSGGTATSWASIDCSAVAPVTAGAVVAMTQNASASVAVQVAQSAAGADFVMTVGPSQAFTGQLPLGASQTLQYKAAGAITGGLTVDVWGYTFER